MPAMLNNQQFNVAEVSKETLQAYLQDRVYDIQKALEAFSSVVSKENMGVIVAKKKIKELRILAQYFGITLDID